MIQQTTFSLGQVKEVKIACFMKCAGLREMPFEAVPQNVETLNSTEMWLCILKYPSVLQSVDPIASCNRNTFKPHRAGR